MSRTAVLLAAIQQELTNHKTSLDADADISSVTITIKLQAGTTRVLRTEYTEERLARHQQRLAIAP